MSDSEVSNSGVRSAPRTRTRTTAIALAVDAVLVLLFAGLGRSSHAREATLLGLLETAWPFLVGLAVIWVSARISKQPLAPLRSGIPIWIGTVVIGLALRALTGGGVALPFVLVATGTLALLLVGWRGIAALATRIAARRRSVSAG